jgi:hypothetical protein
MPPTCPSTCRAAALRARGRVGQHRGEGFNAPRWRPPARSRPRPGHAPRSPRSRASRRPARQGLQAPWWRPIPPRHRSTRRRSKAADSGARGRAGQHHARMPASTTRGCRPAPRGLQRGGRYHQGVDLQGVVRRPLTAALAGRSVRRSTKARANSRQSSPRREDYSPGRRNGLHRLAQIRTSAISQRDEYSLCTSKFESDMPSHLVGLCGARAVRRGAAPRAARCPPKCPAAAPGPMPVAPSAADQRKNWNRTALAGP